MESFNWQMEEGRDNLVQGFSKQHNNSPAWRVADQVLHFNLKLVDRTSHVQPKEKAMNSTHSVAGCYSP